MNIVTIHAEFVPKILAEKYRLVPQQHQGDNQWYKIVVMDHVEVEHLTSFVKELKAVGNG